MDSENRDLSPPKKRQKKSYISKAEKEIILNIHKTEGMIPIKNESQPAEESQGESQPNTIQIPVGNEAEKIIPVKGKPKSGRVWKNDKNRFSSMCQVKPLKTSWGKKLRMRRERKTMQLHALELKQEKEREEQLRKQRRRAKIERQKENERKAEIVQVIKNSAKIKRMSKKQLRKIEKRDTNPTSTGN